jgi:glycosyltransferase involved in cell wall biosynthesis
MKCRGDVLVSFTSRAPALVRRHIVTIHDLFPLTNPEWFSPAYVALHTRLLRYHMKTAAGIAVVSEPVRDEVREIVGETIPIRVVPNAPSMAVAERTTGHWPGLPSKYILAVGNLEPRKNIPRLVRAHESLRPDLQQEYPLIVAGGEARAFRNDRSLRNLKSRYVHFLGRVSDGQLSSLYANASVYASVSLAEGFGIPVVEAAATMRGGLLLSDIASYRWLVDGAPVTWVDPLDEASISAGLAQAISMTPDRSAVAGIASRFSWDESAFLMDSFIREVSEMAT